MFVRGCWVRQLLVRMFKLLLTSQNTMTYNILCNFFFVFFLYTLCTVAHKASKVFLKTQELR